MAAADRTKPSDTTGSGGTGAHARPRIVIVGTGGTIAGAGVSTTAANTYESAVVGVQELIAAVPAIADVADVRGEQLFQIDSVSLTDALLLKLAHRLSALLKQDDVDGIVVTHGTDTMEETAYFLNLVLKSAKPVVVVGSMRPGTALGADGPMNLYNAVVVAASAQSRAKGTLVVMNDEIHTARDVTKTSTMKLETLQSPYGPLGFVVEGETRYYRLPARPHTVATEFDIDRIHDLPDVQVVYAHGNMSRAAYDALAAAGAQGIIHAGMGAGNVPEYIRDALAELRERGVFIVRSTRAGSGAVVRSGAVSDDRYDWIAVDDQNPQKARLLLALALTLTDDTSALQRIFWTY
jgi:glutamin-(asparagin-)ase